jgi:hypothetical protein
MKKNIPNSWITPIRLIYTYLFNLYAWYWLYKILFVLPFDWENLVTWTLACLGMWFFVLDNNDYEYKKKMNDGLGYPELLDKK